MNGPFFTEKERKREKEFHVLFKRIQGGIFIVPVLL